MKLNKYQLLTAGLVGLTVCSGLVLASIQSYADNDTVVDQIQVTVDSGCTMSGSGQTSHTANIPLGTYSAASGSEYENGIGKTTLTTYCNDYNGFSVYAIGYTNNTDGTNTLIGTNTETTINTKVYESTDVASNWSMKVNKVENPVSGDPVTWSPENMTIANGFNTWHTVPSDYTRVAYYKAETDSSATDAILGAKLETTYAAFIANTQIADTYTGQVKYVMVHPYATDPDPYKPSTSSITPPASCQAPVPNLTYMQDLNSSNKASILTDMTEDAQYYLADKRDDKAYCVAKLKDGNIWMTQNLDLDLDSSKTYTSADTDISSDWTPSNSTYTTETTTWNGSANVPESYDPGNLYWNGNVWPTTQESCVEAGGWWGQYDDCFDVDNSYFVASTGNSHYHFGNSYNWTAAVAMNNSASYTEDNTDVNQSICPAGWMLPKSGNNTTSGSFQNMIEQYGWVDYEMTNPHIWESAFYYTLIAGWQGSWGFHGYGSSYWSSTVYSFHDSYGLYATAINDLVISDSDTYRDVGDPVRCVAR